MDRRSQPPYRKTPHPLTSHTSSRRMGGTPAVRAAAGSGGWRTQLRAAILPSPPRWSGRRRGHGRTPRRRSQSRPRHPARGVACDGRHPAPSTRARQPAPRTPPARAGGQTSQATVGRSGVRRGQNVQPGRKDLRDGPMGGLPGADSSSLYCRDCSR